MSAAGFEFSLAQLLALRERVAREAAAELVDAVRAAEVACRASEAAAAERAAARNAMLPAPQTAAPVAALQSTAVLHAALGRQVTDAERVVTARRQVVQERQANLNSRTRDTRVLERLRDREAADWRAREASREREDMDAFARSRFRDVKARRPNQQENH